VIILDTLVMGGLRFVLGKIAAAVEAEMSDDSTLREELLAAQMRLELGEMTEAEYAALERELLDRINEIRARARGPAPSPGRLRITGVEASVAGDEHAADERPGDEQADHEVRGRRRR
jgi:gas vesicle protein GvpG